MISKDKRQVFGFVPEPMKRRLLRIREVDPQMLSESRLIAQGLEYIVPKIEKKLGFFGKPTQDTPGTRKRRAA